jgi:hypothetical protein
MAMTTCVDCHNTYPTASAAKLKALGWRVVIQPIDDARNVSQWRCNPCWTKFRGVTGMPSLPPPPKPVPKR